MLFRSLFSLLLCALVLLNPSSICLAQEEAPITISISSAISILPLHEDDALLKTISDKFNIRFDVISVNASNVSETYRRLAALDSLPDILVYDARWDLNYFLQCGALSPLPENLYEYPNLQSLIAYPYAKALLFGDRLWGIPCTKFDSTSGTVDTCAVFYKDIYDSAWSNAEPPTTIKEWQTLLLNIHTLYPDLIPLTSLNARAMYNLTYFYSPSTYTWVWNGSRFIPGYYSDEFAQSIHALKELWDKDLLDPDFMIENTGLSDGLDKFMLGNAAGLMYVCTPYSWQSEFIPYWQKCHIDEPIDDNLQLVFLPGNEKGEYYETYSYNITSVFFGSGVDEQKMKLILRILDWLCGNEGYTLRNYGLSGEDYLVNADGSITRLTDITGLYAKYPSYAFFRIFPNQESMFTWDNDNKNQYADFVLNQYSLWRKKVGVKFQLLSALNANTVSTPSVVNFYPDIYGSAFRLLNSDNVQDEFEKIRQEYRDAGIQQMIDSVFYAIK